MTYQYSDINQHDARYNLARDYPGGIEMLAKRMGMSVNVLRNKLAPGIRTHHTTDEEDSLIIEYSVEAHVPNPYRALIAKNFRHGLVAFPLVQFDHLPDIELTRSLCETVKQFSQLAADASEAISDKRITPQELATLEADAQKALAAIAELRERWRARAQECGVRLHEAKD